MFGMGGVEMLVIGIVALIVVGPKDLPMLFRQVGQFVGKARGMAREFQSAMNQAVDQSGMKDVQSSLKAATNPMGAAMNSVKDAARDATEAMNLDPDSETGKLAAKRAEQTKKIQASTARAAAERKAREATEALVKADEAEAALTPAPKAKAAKPKVAKPTAAKPKTAAKPSKPKTPKSKT
jgi:sec-independent protein translocase protein TatB